MYKRQISSRVSPGEFAYQVQRAVEEDDVRLVIVDSLTGYASATGEASQLALRMHELLGWLSRSGVLSVVVAARGSGVTRIDLGYLSDTILVFRWLEHAATVRRCVAAVKKRHGEHDTTLRELFIGPGLVSVTGEPLAELRPQERR